MTNNDFPWFLNQEKTMTSSELYNYQFTHLFYNSFEKTSNYFFLIDPIINKINPISIIKIKANLTTFFENQFQYDFHTDYDYPCYTAVYYINSNNGYTLFNDGTKIESIENRIAVFDSDILHTAVSSNDSKYRCVININYIGRENE